MSDTETTTTTEQSDPHTHTEPPAVSMTVADGEAPQAPRVQVLADVVQLGGQARAGVRVQHLPGAGAGNPVKADGDVFKEFMRVHRGTLVQVRDALDSAESLGELRATVRTLLASQFEQLT